MPWTVGKSSSCPASRPWAVTNQTNGHIDGCHPTKARARAQQRALYASERPRAGAALIGGVTLTQELQQATRAVEERYLAALVGVWERVIRDSGEAAAEQFALVAAADWQPPAEGAALTALRLAALAEALKRGASPIWRKVLLEVAVGPLARIGVAWDVKHPLFAGQLEKAAQRTGQRLGEAVQPVLRATIADAYERGLPVPETSALIRAQIADAAPWQADMLARTDLNSLANGASKAAASLTGMQFKTWLATMDEKTRPEHADADGQTVPINDPFDVGGEDLDYPGDPAGSDAMTCNCVAEGSQIELPGLRAVMRRRYEGDLIRIRFATGDELAVTPNHPVLRADGFFVSAGELIEGDYCIGRPLSRHLVSEPDVEYPPAEVSEVYRAAECIAQTKRIRTRPEWFHSDGMDGNVDVVTVDRALMFDGEATTAEHLQEFGLALADRARLALSNAADPIAVTVASGLDAIAAPPLVRGRSQASALLDRHGAHAEVHGVATTARRDSAIEQTAADGRTANAKAARERQFAFAGKVTRYEIVQIERESTWQGWVYNFDTGDGFYLSGNGVGICLGNCRCSLAYGESLDEAQGLLADGGTRMAHMTRRQRAKKGSRLAAQKKAPTEALVAGAVAVHHTPVVAGTWDGNAAMGRCSSAADFRSICAAFESGGDLSQRQSWHLPHHANPNGPANINGVRNALARTPQTTSISASDRAGATAHLRAHLNDFNRRQGSNAILGLAKMSLEEALAAMDETWGLIEEPGDDEFLQSLKEEFAKPLLAAKLPSGMDSPPDGVTHCQMNGTPGFSGGGMCHVHNGSDAGMQSAMRKAQADARKNSQHAMLAAARPVGFHGTAVIEGRISDDNSIAPRVILPDSLSWPEMPVPFMAQTVTAEGHAGAEVAGRVDEFARSRGSGKQRNIDFGGELTTPFGIDEIAPMIDDKTLRYVSADLGASEWSLVDRKTFAVVSQEDFDLAAATDGAYALGCTSAKIKAVTLVPTQAIEGAMVALVAAAEEHGAAIEVLGEDEYRVIARLEMVEPATLTASAAPTRPPRGWFETPEPPGKMPLTVTEDGRVFGHLATWDSCHVGFLPSCVPPPKSDSSYAYFHVCELDTEGGEPVTVGKLMFSPTDGGHADRSLSAAKASAYYDRTGMAAAYLSVIDGQHGIWAAGVLNPDLTDEQRQEMRRQLRLHPPSGDWRPINGQYELICALAVAVPGFPTPRATVTITAAGEELVLEDAIIASSGLIEADPAAIDALEQQGLVDEEMRAEREMRELVGRANWRAKLGEILKG